MSERQESKIEDLCDVGSSKRVKMADYVKSGIPFFRSKEVIELSKGNSISTELFITEEHFKNISDKYGHPSIGDILLTSVGTLGVPYHVEAEELPFYFKDGNLTWFKNFKKCINSRWLYYWLLSPQGKNKINEISIGSTQRAITIIALKGISLNIPDIEHQNEVVSILDSVTRKIENNRRMNKTLEKVAQAIFKSWFVDFDPVHAKVEVLKNGGSADDARLKAMCAISGKSTEDLASLKSENSESYAELERTADAFPSAFTDSELGKIPEGWEVKKIENVAKVIKGKSYKSSELTESKTALVTLKSFNRGGGYRLDGLKEYTGTYRPDQEVFAGDLVIACTDVTQAADVIGKPAMVISDSRYDHLVISLDVVVVKPNRNSVKYYLYGLTQTEQFQQHTNAHSTGTTVLHLSRNAVPEYQFALPNDSLIKAYERTVKPIFILVNESIEENKTLAKTRDALLPRLLSGEINVSQRGNDG